MTPDEREQLQEVATILRKILRHKQRRVDLAFDIAIAVAAAIVALLAIISGMWILLISVGYVVAMNFYLTPQMRKSRLRLGWDLAWSRAITMSIQAGAPSQLMQEMRTAEMLVPNNDTMRMEQEMMLRDIEAALAKGENE